VQRKRIVFIKNQVVKGGLPRANRQSEIAPQFQAGESKHRASGDGSAGQCPALRLNGQPHRRAPFNLF
jgi:hypothetical protein